MYSLKKYIKSPCFNFFRINYIILNVNVRNSRHSMIHFSISEKKKNIYMQSMVFLNEKHLENDKLIFKLV